MAVVKVAVTAVPAMLREVLQQLLEGAADMELVALPATNSPRRGQNLPDVTVLATNDDSDDTCWQSLRDNPESSVVALDSRGQQAFLCQLRRHKEALGEPSADGILDAIRRASRGPEP